MVFMKIVIKSLFKEDKNTGFTAKRAIFLFFLELLSARKAGGMELL